MGSEKKINKKIYIKKLKKGLTRIRTGDLLQFWDWPKARIPEIDVRTNDKLVSSVNLLPLNYQAILFLVQNPLLYMMNARLKNDF